MVFVLVFLRDTSAVSSVMGDQGWLSTNSVQAPLWVQCHLGKIMKTSIFVPFPGGIGVGEMLSHPSASCQGTPDNPVSFLTTRAILAVGGNSLGVSTELLGQMQSGQGGAMSPSAAGFGLSWCPAPCLALGCWDMCDTGPAEPRGVTLFPMWSPHVHSAAPLPPAPARC